MRRVLSVAVLVGVAACGRSGLLLRATDGGAGTSGAAGTGFDGAAGTDVAGAGGTGAGGTGASVIGWGGLVRLTDVEYDNTLRDVLSVADSARIAALQGRLPADAPPEAFGGFDNAAAGQSISPERYQWYFASAVAVVELLWASEAFVKCPPATSAELCAGAFTRDLGRRLWRRPLSPIEVDDLVALMNAAMAGGADFQTAMKQVVVALLVSEPFLFRVELDPDPNAPFTHPLNGYELATRLSYLIWSSAPDLALLDAAEAGELATPEGVRAQVRRLLIEQRADGFVRNFAGQWLGFRQLEYGMLPGFTQVMTQAAWQEARQLVDLIVKEDRPVTDLLTTDVNFVDAALAETYGIPGSYLPGVPQRVSVSTDARRGFLGYAAPFITTSLETESSPSRRGVFVQTRLLCQVLPPGHPNTPAPMLPGRARVEMTAAMPSCAACHKHFDPIGLGLERFDAWGRYRTKYASGGAVDDLGVMPDGTPFRGPGELGDLVAADPKFRACVARKAVTYALGRQLAAGDEPALERIGAAFTTSGLTVRGLLEAIVVDDVFRMRRGEGTP